jgi:hypothetical protein
MNCFECAPETATPAVATCSGCSVGLCVDHVATVRVYTQQTVAMATSTMRTSRRAVCPECGGGAATAHTGAARRAAEFAGQRG